MSTLNADKAEAIKQWRNGDEPTKKMLEKIFGKETFESSDICDLVQDFDDVLKLTNPDEEVLTLLKYPGTNRTMIGAVAEAQADLIAEAYAEGSPPDATKVGVEIWFPVFERPKLGFSHSSYVGRYAVTFAGARLGFKSEKHATDAGNKFGDIYRKLILK